MESYTINNNMEVMEYLDMGTPKDLEFQKNGLNFSDPIECQFQANLLKLYFRSRQWPDGEFKIVLGTKQLEIEKIDTTLPLDICFSSPNQALEFMHKNEELVDVINEYLAGSHFDPDPEPEPEPEPEPTPEPVYDEEGNEEL